MMVQGTHVQIKILSHGHLGRCSGSSTEGHCLPQAVETIRTSARNTPWESTVAVENPCK